MIVRHPFYRLVSAFRAMFENSKCLKVASQIVKSFRHQAKARGRNTKKELFLATRNMLPEKEERQARTTFWEFVQAVLKKDAWNPPILGNQTVDLEVHWRPMYQQCSVCHTTILSNLKYILKYENLNAEEDQFISFLGWNQIRNHKAHVLHHDRPRNKLERDKTKLTKLYFRTLDKVDVYGLYMKYKPDFDLFGYPFRLEDWS